MNFRNKNDKNDTLCLHRFNHKRQNLMNKCLTINSKLLMKGEIHSIISDTRITRSFE